MIAFTVAMPTMLACVVWARDSRSPMPLASVFLGVGAQEIAPRQSSPAWVRDTHPDKNPSPDAEARFVIIAEACA